MSVIQRQVAVGDVELALCEAGVGGRRLLIVHGFTGRASDFGDYIEPLAAAGWHVVAPDLRGHGASSHPSDEDAYSLDRFTADLIALTDAIGFDRYVVLGHSMGGMITQQLVLSEGDRIAGVILMDTGHGPLHVDPALIELGVTVARTEGIDVLADLMAALEDDPLTTDAYRRKVAEDPAYAERGDQNLRASSPAMFAAMLQQIPNQADRLPLLGSVTAPTLVVVGAEDTPFLAPSERMAAAIPGARLAVLPGGGHSPQFEAPDVWWEAVSGFLSEIADRVEVADGVASSTTA
jgi:pimeloyl-ACP methyl ester carboxylesterase